MKLSSPIAATILFSLAAPFAAADPLCQPVSGRFEALIVPSGSAPFCPATAALCTAGRVWGGINGNYEFVLTALVPAGSVGGIPTALFYTGTSSITMHDGGLVVGTDSGALDPPPHGQRGFASLISFVAGGTGQIRLFGQFVGINGTEGEYEGQLCR